MRIRVAPLLLPAVIACAAKAPNAATTDVAATRKAIEAVEGRFMPWVAAGAVDSIVTQYYAPDAVFLLANQPPAVGTEGIRKAFDGMMGIGKFRYQLKTVSVQAVDSLASEYGTYSLEVRAKPPADTTKVLMQDHGSYVTTFVRRSGQWRAIYDIAVSDVPMPAPAPAPAIAPAKK